MTENELRSRIKELEALVDEKTRWQAKEDAERIKELEQQLRDANKVTMAFSESIDRQAATIEELRMREITKKDIIDKIANDHKPPQTLLQDWARGIASDLEEFDDIKSKLKALDQENKDLVKLLCSRDSRIKVLDASNEDLRGECAGLHEKVNKMDIALAKHEKREAEANARIKALKLENEAERAHSCHLVVEKNNEINLLKDKLKDADERMENLGRRLLLNLTSPLPADGKRYAHKHTKP